MSRLPGGTVTFLFTDVERSTELVRRHQERYAGLLGEARVLLRKTFAEWNGLEVDTQGDSFFVVFTSAREAALAAVAGQRALNASRRATDERLRVRMGLHTAEPHQWAEGYVGVGVHRASRICAVGHGGQILLSRSAAGLVDDSELEGVSLRDLGAHRLKGLQSAERIFQLVVDGLASEFPPLATLEGAGVGTETATILVSDVSGFTPLVRELPPDLFRVLVADLNRTLQSALEASGGRGIVMLGDGALAVFRSARAAVEAAVHLRDLISAREWPAGRRLSIKIGLHSGEVVATAYGYFGVAVHRSFSLCRRAEAEGAQILLSEATRSLLEEDDASFRELSSPLAGGAPPLAGGAPLRTYELVAPSAQDDARAAVSELRVRQREGGTTRP